jgi:hypothetical protein
MAWKISAAKRRALVKLQLRDKKGRWIEMGKGVKWYSSKLKKEISGTVVDGKGSKAIVRLNKEHGGSLVGVEAHQIEVIDSKATLAPKGEKSVLDTPEFEKPKPVAAKPKAVPAKEGFEGKKLSEVSAEEMAKMPSGTRLSAGKDSASFTKEEGDNWKHILSNGEASGNVSSSSSIKNHDGFQEHTFGEKSNEAGSDEEKAEPLEERSYPAAIDENDPNSYKSTKTSDGKYYFGRADQQGIYTPASELKEGDELIAPDGTDDSKPFSIGAKWNRRGVERVAEGKGLGTVESIVPDRYAIVKLPEGYAAPDGRNTVTVGLRNDVIKATPGLKKSLESAGFKFNENSPEEEPESESSKSSEPVDPDRAGMDDRRKRNNAAKVSAAQQGDKLVAERPEGNLTFTKTGDNQWEDSDGGSGLTDEDVTNTPIHLNEWTPEPLTGKKTENEPEEAEELESAPEPSEAPSEPADQDAKTLARIVEGLAQLDQDVEDIESHNLKGEDLAAAVDEARFSFPDANGDEWTLSAVPDGEGEWSYNLTDQEGNDKGSLLPAKYDSYEQIAEDIHKSVNATAARSRGEQKSTEEPVKPAEPAPAESYNENGLTEDEQRTADALARMADKADERGDFDKSDYLMAQYMELMKKGEERRKQKPASEPEPEPAPTPNLVEPETDPELERAKQRYNEIVDGLKDAEIDSPERRAYDSAMDNATDSVNEGSVERGSKEWYDIINSSYSEALERESQGTPAAPNLVEPEPAETKDDNEIVAKGTILTHKSGKKRIVSGSGKANPPRTSRDFIASRNLRNGEPFGPTLFNNPDDFEELRTPAAEPAESPAPSGRKSTMDDWKDSLEELTEEVRSDEHKSAGNYITAAIQKLNGLDGAPTVVSKEDFDTHPGKKLYRGVSSSDQAERFNTGPNWVGEGGSGSGIYTSTNRFRGESFKRAEGGALMEMKLNPDANIADGVALEKERRADFEKASAEGNTAGMFLSDGDMGKYAAARGFDGYTVPPVDPYSDDEEYVVLTNRAAVSVLGEPASGNESESAPATEPAEAPVQAPVDGPTTEPEAEPEPVSTPEPAPATDPNNLEPSIGSSMFPDGFSIQKDRLLKKFVSRHTGDMRDAEFTKMVRLNREYQHAQNSGDPAKVAKIERDFAELARSIDSRLKNDPENSLRNRKIDALELYDVNNVLRKDDFSDRWTKGEDGNWTNSKTGQTATSAELVDLIGTDYLPKRDRDMAEIDKATEPAEPSRTLTQKTDDGHEVRESETEPGYLEVVAPDGRVARRVKMDDPNIEQEIESGLKASRESYEARQESQRKIDARNTAIANLTPFEPFTANAPAKHFRDSSNINKGDRLLTSTRGNGSEEIIQVRQSGLGQQQVAFSGKSALVIDSKAIMGQNKTSMGKVVGSRVTVQHSDGKTETVDLYGNRGGSNDKAGVIIDSPEFREEFGLKAPANEPNENEGQNGTESGTEGTPEPVETEAEGTPVEGPDVPEPSGGDGGTGNDPASGTEGPDSGEGTGSGSDTGRPLTQEEIDSLPDDEIILDSDGNALAKNEDGEWYSVAKFLEDGDKEGLPSDLLAGEVTRREGSRKYGEAEITPAVNYFVSNSFKNVNDYVRNGNDPNRNLPGYSDTVVDVMDDAIAHSPLEKDSTFFRGLQINSAEAEKFIAGSIINDKGFTSVSKRKSIAEEFAKHSSGLTGVPAPEDHVPVLLQLNLPKGHNALAVDYSKTEHDFSHQQEHILGRDSSLRVDSVEVSEKDGKKFYTLQVSPATEEDFKVIPKAEPSVEPSTPEVEFPEGVVRRTPEALDGEKFPPTQQQQDVIDAVLGGLDTLVQAKAGAGKTTTLEAIARRIQKYKKGEDQVLYIAFNTTVAAEAVRRMPSNVEARTGHSLSYRWSPEWMKSRMRGKKSRTALRNGQDIADHIGIKGDLKIDSMEDPLEPYDQAVLAMKAVDTYAFSADDEIGIHHFPEDFHDRGEVSDKLVEYANAIWADLSSEDGVIKFSQDAARKHWALSRPDLSQSMGGWTGANVVFIDEAQDTPPVLAKVVADQKIQRVVVGDADQAIYGFTGATDYLSQAKGDIELPLNKSWRFGPQVADIGNRFLELLKSKGRVVGGGPESTIEYGMEDPDAILVRSNAGMVSEILNELGKGRTVGVPAKTKKDLVNLFNHADQLKNNFRGSAFHEDLAAYKTWKEFAKAAEDGEDQKATMIYNLIEAYGIPELQRMIGRVQDPEDSVENRGEKHPLSSPIGELFSKIDVQRKGGDVILAGGTWAFNAKLKETLEERGLSGLGWRWDSAKKQWFAKGNTPDEKEAVYKRLENLMLEQDGGSEEPAIEVKKPDVIISTAHKAKGLEWGRVKIGKDFKGPKTDETTGKVTMPNDDELRLAYVAVTRAEKSLDPGSLGYVFEHTSENGGSVGGTPSAPSEPVEAPTVEPVEAPEPVNVPEPEPVSAPEPVEPEPVDVPEPTQPEPAEAEPVDIPVEPEPAPVSTPVEPEPEPEPTPVPGYNENGYTEAEQQRVDALEALIAAVYRGDAEGDIETLEGELDEYYAAAQSRLSGVDVPEIQYNAPEPVKPAPAPAPRKPRTSMTGVTVKSFDGKELEEGMKVRHAKYTGEVIKVIPSAGTVKIRKEDGTEVFAKGHKVSVIGEGSEPVQAPVVSNLVAGSAGVDPVTGVPYFVGRDGKVFQTGDPVVHAKKGEGTVKAIYVGATSVAVDWADGTSSRSQANALFGKDNGGASSPEPTEPPAVAPTKPEPAPVKPEPTVTEPPAAPAVKLSGQFTEPEPKSKLSVKGGEIEGGDPVGKTKPVSPHGDPLPGDQSDLMMLSMLYPQGTIITYYNKTKGVQYRIKKVEGDVWHELKDNGFITEGSHQYIPHLSRMQMAVKPNWEGKRDSRMEAAPDNEEFLNSIPVGATVTTVHHYDGKEKVWTKIAPGYWKNDEIGGLFNSSLWRYGIGDYTGIGDGYLTPDYKAAGWTEYEGGKTRAMKLFKLTEGSEVSFARTPNVYYVKENGKWSEVIRGKKTGLTLANLSAESNAFKDTPAYVNSANAVASQSYVSSREKPANMVGDPKEIEAVFGSDISSYAGVSNLFREYDKKTSPFNTANVATPIEPRYPDRDLAEYTNSRGDKFVIGSRIYDTNGDYLGKVGRIVKPWRSEGPESDYQIHVIHARGDNLYGVDTYPKYNPESVTSIRTKHWDTSTDLDFSDYNSVPEISRKMNETYGGFFFDMRPRMTDIRTARQFAETVSKIFNKYPMLQESMAFVGTEKMRSATNGAAYSHGPVEYGISGDPNESSYDPKYGHVGSRVGINVGKTYETFVHDKQYSVKTRWNNFIEEGREVEATTTHEFGHVIDYFTGKISEDKILEFVSEVLGRKVTENTAALGNELFENQLLSDYSRKFDKIYPIELVAESFQDVEMNGANAKDLSKLVHQELMRRLAILGQPSVESSNSNVGASSEGVAV